MKTLQADDFWHFSLEFYARPYVEGHCLALQDRFGFNVNVILLCAFTDVFDLTLSSEQIVSLAAGISDIDKETALHRERRRLLEKGTDAYTQALQQELALEKQQQNALIELVNELPMASGSNSLENLRKLAEPNEAQQRINSLIVECQQVKETQR